MIFRILTLLLLVKAARQYNTTNLDEECCIALDGMVAMSIGSGGYCGRKACQPQNFPRQCEKLIKEVEKIQMTGLFHTYKSLLSSIDQRITIGGNLVIPNLFSYRSQTCDLNRLPMCQKNEDLNEKRWCSYNEKKLNENFFQIQPSLRSVSPVVDKNWKLLPFPNLFHVIIVNVQSFQSCQKSLQPIICHTFLEETCRFNMCHQNNATTLIQVTVRYEKLTVDLTMVCHVESIENYRTENRLRKILRESGGQETLCHFASPQTNFFLC